MDGLEHVLGGMRGAQRNAGRLKSMYTASVVLFSCPFLPACLTKHVWVGRPPLSYLADRVRHDAFPIRLRHGDHLEGDSEGGADLRAGRRDGEKRQVM